MEYLSNTRGYIEGHWYFDPARLAMCYIAPGEYAIGSTLPIAMQITTHLLPGLYEAAMDAGVLPLTPSRESRAEDIKIIHRLLDVLSKMSSNDNR